MAGRYNNTTSTSQGYLPPQDNEIRRGGIVLKKTTLAEPSNVSAMACNPAMDEVNAELTALFEGYKTDVTMQAQYYADTQRIYTKLFKTRGATWSNDLELDPLISMAFAVVYSRYGTSPERLMQAGEFIVQRAKAMMNEFSA